jgi:hypothetical protein
MHCAEALILKCRGALTAWRPEPQIATMKDLHHPHETGAAVSGLCEADRVVIDAGGPSAGLAEDGYSLRSRPASARPEGALKYGRIGLISFDSVGFNAKSSTVKSNEITLITWIGFDPVNAQRGSAPWIVAECTARKRRPRGANARRASAWQGAERIPHRSRSFNRLRHGGKAPQRSLHGMHHAAALPGLSRSAISMEAGASIRSLKPTARPSAVNTDRITLIRFDPIGPTAKPSAVNTDKIALIHLDSVGLRTFPVSAISVSRFHGPFRRAQGPELAERLKAQSLPRGSRPTACRWGFRRGGGEREKW